jgi:cycloeucalenol cycloisomerase
LLSAAEASRSAPPRARIQLFSANPGKAWTERFWLLFTPVWGLLVGGVMIGGFASHWGDAEMLGLGAGTAAIALLGPIVWRHPSERGLSWHDLPAVKLGASVTGFALFLNYSQTPFFFDVLHMHYGFHTEINIQNNPVALYLLSVTYFTTYCAILTLAYRAVRSGLAGAPKAARYAAIGVVPFAVAFLETALNANPFIPDLFCYDEMGTALGLGTLAYGTNFCFALPMWVAIGERRERPVAWREVGIWLFAAMYATVIALDVYRYHVAPHVTTVNEGAPGLRDYGDNCLVPPAGIHPGGNP